MWRTEAAQDSGKCWEEDAQPWGQPFPPSCILSGFPNSILQSLEFYTFMKSWGSSLAGTHPSVLVKLDQFIEKYRKWQQQNPRSKATRKAYIESLCLQKESLEKKEFWQVDKYWKSFPVNVTWKTRSRRLLRHTDILLIKKLQTPHVLAGAVIQWIAISSRSRKVCTGLPLLPVRLFALGLRVFWGQRPLGLMDISHRHPGCTKWATKGNWAPLHWCTMANCSLISWLLKLKEFLK